MPEKDNSAPGASGAEAEKALLKLLALSEAQKRQVFGQSVIIFPLLNSHSPRARFFPQFRPISMQPEIKKNQIRRKAVFLGQPFRAIGNAKSTSSKLRRV